MSPLLWEKIFYCGTTWAFRHPCHLLQDKSPERFATVCHMLSWQMFEVLSCNIIVGQVDWSDFQVPCTASVLILVSLEFCAAVLALTTELYCLEMSGLGWLPLSLNYQPFHATTHPRPALEPASTEPPSNTTHYWEPPSTKPFCYQGGPIKSIQHPQKQIWTSMSPHTHPSSPIKMKTPAPWTNAAAIRPERRSREWLSSVVRLRISKCSSQTTRTRKSLNNFHRKWQPRDMPVTEPSSCPSARYWGISSQRCGIVTVSGMCSFTCAHYEELSRIFVVSDIVISKNIVDMAALAA